jgi:hypothetical protein
MVSDREWWTGQGIPTDRCEDPGWDELATALPPEVAALLGDATPQTGPAGDRDGYGDGRDTDRRDGNGNGRDGNGRDGNDRDDDDTERWPGRGDPCAVGPTHWAASSTYAACTPRFLAPPLPRSRSRRVRRHATRAR